MKLRDAIQKAVDAANSPELLDIRNFEPMIFRLDQHEWPVLAKVTDPQKLDANAVARLRLIGDARQLVYTDLRILKLHPQEFERDNVPYPGCTTAYCDGTLEVVQWSEPSKWTGTRVGTCVLRRP